MKVKDGSGAEKPGKTPPEAGRKNGPEQTDSGQNRGSSIREALLKNMPAAIVLAAGESRRMGTQKLLLPFDGKPMIARVVENIIAAGIEEIIVVTGYHDREIRVALDNWPVTFSFNEDFRRGMLSSVICGIRTLAANYSAIPSGGETETFLLFLGDQPFIPPQVIRSIIAAAFRSHKGIITPVFEGKRGHPTLFSMKYFPEILNLPHEEGLRRLLRDHPDDIMEVKVGFQEIVKDIDTKNEYLNELKKHKPNQDGREGKI